MPLRLSGDAKLEINELVISNSSSVSLPANTIIGNVDSTEIGYLDNVTNPIQTQLNTKANSASVQAQLDLKSNLDSPAFTGTPTAPTAASGTNTTQISTTAYAFAAASSASANVNTRALGYATSASANVNTRALGYANSASAHVSSITQIQLDNKEKSIPLQSSAPTSPASSDLWVDSLSMQLKVYNGTSWVALGAAVDDSQLIIAQRMFI